MDKPRTKTGLELPKQQERLSEYPKHTKIPKNESQNKLQKICYYYWYLNHGPLELKTSVLPMSYTNPCQCKDLLLVKKFAIRISDVWK